ncbi:MAG: hypothetical protein Q8O13_02555 [Candidatus Omnitrophota bacterium]|nr:hypothetical protein [Candidatus Omnitrophota bacterium]
MENYSRKLFLRIGILLFLVILILAFSFNLTISSTLNKNHSQIKRVLQKSFNLEFEFGKISFSLLNGLKFNDLMIFKDGKELLFLKELRIYISLPQLLTKGFVLNKILAIDGITSTEFFYFKDYLISRLENLAKFSKDKLKMPHIYLRNLKIFLGNKSINKGFILLNSNISFRLENLSCDTELDFSRCDFSNPFLENLLFLKFSKKNTLHLQLAFMLEDVLINSIVARVENIKISGAGIIYNFKTDPYMDIKFITLPLNLKELVAFKSKIVINGLLNIVANIKGQFKDPHFQTELMLSKSELYLFTHMLKLSNVFCNINFKNNEIIIKELTALVNYRIPLYIKGRITNFTHPKFEFNIESSKVREVDFLSKESINFMAKINSMLEADSLVGDGNVTIIFTKDTPHYKISRVVNLSLRNLKFSLEEDAKVASSNYSLNVFSQDVSLTNKEMFNNELKNKQDLQINNLNAKLLPSQDGLINLRLSCQGYNGQIEASGRLHLVNNKAKQYFFAKFINLSVQDLKALYPVTSDISGNLNGWLYFKSEKTSFLEGAISVKDAHLSKIGLLDAIADFLGIQSIKELKGAVLFTNFVVNEFGTQVKRFNLQNDKLNLTSSININDKNWLRGTVWLSLPKNILEESDILRVLLSLVKQTSGSIDFNFAVSGFLKALRIELLEGEFRDKLIKRLSTGVRAQIENEINKAIITFRERSHR